LGQFTASVFRKWQPDIDLPTDALQLFGRDQRVTAVVTFAGKNNATRRSWEELPDRSGNSRAGLIH
jgi:hypothetical protein